MKQIDYTIRSEKMEEQREVELLVREAFWNKYRPGCSEHYVLHKLRDDPAFVKELSFVLEREGRIIGQIIFVRATILADDGRSIPVLTMGPISIHPDFQGQGYGKILLDYALLKAVSLHYSAVFLEGDISFYGKSGFRFAREYSIRYHGLPEGMDDSFFLGKELMKGALDGVVGTYATPNGYFVEDEDVEAFDSTFPYREKKVLPGQLF